MDLETIPVDEPFSADTTPFVAPRSNPHAKLIIGLTGVVLAAAFAAPSMHDSEPTGDPTPVTPAPTTSEDVANLPQVVVAHVATVLGNEIVERNLAITVDDGPVGSLIPSSASTPTTETLSLTGTVVVAQGTDMKGGGRTGTWSYDVAGRRPQLFLGFSTGFVPSVNPGMVWLTSNTQVWEVEASNGAVVDGPYRLDGQLIASAGLGLVLQRGARVVWWLPHAPPKVVDIGTGRALAALDDRVVWESSSGAVTITDPANKRRTSSGPSLDPSRAPGPAALSPASRWLALASGQEVILARLDHTSDTSDPLRFFVGGPVHRRGLARRQHAGGPSRPPRPDGDRYNDEGRPPLS